MYIYTQYQDTNISPIFKEKIIKPDNGPDLGWDGDAACFLHKQKYTAELGHHPTYEQLEAPIWHLQKEMTLPWETVSTVLNTIAEKRYRKLVKMNQLRSVRMIIIRKLEKPTSLSP